MSYKSSFAALFRGAALSCLLMTSVAFARSPGQLIENQQSLTSHVPGGRVGAASALQSGVPVTIALPAVSSTTAFVNDFWIQVPTGAERLRVTLSGSDPAVDIDLYIRFGQPVSIAGGRPVAGWISESLSANEVITINSPAPGAYHFGIGLLTLHRSTIATLVATITEGCTYSLSPISTTMQASGGDGSFQVTTNQGCSWSATTTVGWLTIVGGSTNVVGSGTVSYRVAQNAGAQRTGQIRVGNRTFTVTQMASVTPPIPADSRVLSHVVNGGGWTTEFLLTNLSTIRESYEIRFYGGDGKPWSLPIVGRGASSSITGTLAGGEMLMLETAGSLTEDQGWAIVIPGTRNAERLSGFAVFRQNIPGRTLAEGTVPLAPFDRRTFVWLYDNTNNFETGVAFVNPDANMSLTLDVTVRDEAGRTLVTERLTLPPLGHTAFAMSQRFPASVRHCGSVHVSASSEVVGLGLRFNPFGVFTSFEWLTSDGIQP